METRNLLVMGAWAIGTVSLLTAIAPISLDAGNNSASVAPAIQTPTLKVNGCELSMVSDLPANTDLSPGAKLAVRLVMLNPTKDSIETPYTVRLMVTPPISRMSRTMPMSTEQWSQTDTCTLAPGERKEVALDVARRLAAGERGTFVIASGKQQVFALGLFAKPDPAASDLRPASPAKRVASGGTPRESKASLQ